MSTYPSAEMLERIQHVPIYRDSLERGHFPILEKTDIADGFPDNWMTPELATALENGDAEYVLSTGTNHARMQLIRPPYFLLRSYYQLWSEHPDLADTWNQGCQRVSLTTVLATEHVARVNAKKHGTEPSQYPELAERWRDSRTVYVNRRLDPALWDRVETEQMLAEIRMIARNQHNGDYHLDCSSYYLAELLRKIERWDLWELFPKPANIVHAYEFTPNNVKRFLRNHFDCPIIDLFGSTELGYLYYSDRQDEYQPFLDKMHIELIPVAKGSTIHSIIVSSIRNPHMPLIRYRSGDCARTADGSPDPSRITRFCGREKELLWPVSGGAPTAHGDLDDWLSQASTEIFTYQLHLTATRTQLRYTTFNGQAVPTESLSEVRERLTELTGNRCETVHSEHIPIGKSGKYAWLIDQREPDQTEQA